MMINKRLIGIVPESKKYIAGNVVFQWASMLANAGMIAALAVFLQALLKGEAAPRALLLPVGAGILSLAVRCVCSILAARMSFLAAKSIKLTLRTRIYEKLLRLGPSYSRRISTSEVVQFSTEGVEQLESYFGAYLPQFFYSMIAPLTLFILLSPISLKAAGALLLCVPLIPISIAAVQTFAKKLLGKYWGQYAALGDTFLENLQGLTTLKIYEADGAKHKEMNREAENFRRITMRVLTMQLNSITIMDLVAYGGAALGMILAVREFAAGAVSFAGCFGIILLSADFFLPMRQLGSYFHIAMNGMAASDKIFAMLDLPEDDAGTKTAVGGSLSCRGLRFSYNEDREVLHGVDMEFAQGMMTAIVGESGCGKSTVASILTGRSRGYIGSAALSGTEISELSGESLLRTITYVGSNGYVLAGSIAECLRTAKPGASDDELWAVLERVRLAGFVRAQQGLDTPVSAGGTNLSGGQRQRLCLARALLHDTPCYVFDEATSNIDVESENDIMDEIRALAKTRTVIVITHRLANVTDAAKIYVMEAGACTEAGTHEELLQHAGAYAALWESQQKLEQFASGEVMA